MKLVLEVYKFISVSNKDRLIQETFSFNLSRNNDALQVEIVQLLRLLPLPHTTNFHVAESKRRFCLLRGGCTTAQQTISTSKTKIYFSNRHTLSPWYQRTLFIELIYSCVFMLPCSYQWRSSTTLYINQVQPTIP